MAGDFSAWNSDDAIFGCRLAWPNLPASKTESKTKSNLPNSGLFFGLFLVSNDSQGSYQSQKYL